MHGATVQEVGPPCERTPDCHGKVGTLCCCIAAARNRPNEAEYGAFAEPPDDIRIVDGVRECIGERCPAVLAPWSLESNKEQNERLLESIRPPALADQDVVEQFFTEHVRLRGSSILHGSDASQGSRRRRDGLTPGGELHDTLVFAMLREEYEAALPGWRAFLLGLDRKG